MKLRITGLIMIGSVLILVVLYAQIVLTEFGPIKKQAIENIGVFGDSFGILTSLFSGLAFAGLIITILMQKEELALQRNELELTREVLSDQKNELKTQNSTLLQQRFENTFFQMLTLHNEIVKSIDIQKGHQIHNGRDAFKTLHQNLIGNNNLKPRLSSGSLADINYSYSLFYDGNQHEIGHYFRNLYNIIKFVDLSSIENKKTYTNLVRAQLSSYELFFIFYNCLSDMGREKFKPLVEKYSLLKTLPEKLILNPQEQKTLYEESAFSSGAQN